MARKPTLFVPFVFLVMGCLTACGGGGGGGDGAVDDAEPGPVDSSTSLDTTGDSELPEPDVPCVPDCEGRVCGDDGCGGSCGSCPGGESCDDDGTCEPECGNGLCKAFENCNSCHEDCGGCCGNGSCDSGWGENCDTCSYDCACDGVGACVDGECVECLDTATVEGGFNWSCEDHTDCLLGYCVPDDGVCSCPCMEEEDCPDGWTCGQVDLDGGDVAYVCVPECDLPVLTGTVWLVNLMTIYSTTGVLGLMLPPSMDPRDAGIWILIRVDAHDLTLGTFELQVGYGTAKLQDVGGTPMLSEIAFGGEPVPVAAHLDGCDLVLDVPFSLPLAAPGLTGPLVVEVMEGHGELLFSGGLLSDLRLNGGIPFEPLESLCAELAGFETANLHELLFEQGICPDTDLDGDTVPDGSALEIGLDASDTQWWIPGIDPFAFLDLACPPHTEVCTP